MKQQNNVLSLMGFIFEWKKRRLVGNETEETAKGHGKNLDFTGTVMESHWKFLSRDVVKCGMCFKGILLTAMW